MSEAKLLIELPIAMRWRDLDAFNHANNSIFLTYIEEARLHWFAQMEGAWLTEKLAPVVAAIQVNYRRQLAWPANLVVQLLCERVATPHLRSGIALSMALIAASSIQTAKRCWYGSTPRAASQLHCPRRFAAPVSESLARRRAR